MELTKIVTRIRLHLLVWYLLCINRIYDDINVLFLHYPNRKTKYPVLEEAVKEIGLSWMYLTLAKVKIAEHFVCVGYQTVRLEECKTEQQLSIIR